MPTYDYRCDHCAHAFEEFQSITAAPLKKCPACGRRTLQRLIGTGGGIIFKGSGFYQTDYRSDSYKKAAEAETKAASPPKTDDKGSKDTSTAPASPATASQPTKPAPASAPAKSAEASKRAAPAKTPKPPRQGKDPHRAAS